jgi:hypothetical protein
MPNMLDRIIQYSGYTSLDDMKNVIPKKVVNPLTSRKRVEFKIPPYMFRPAKQAICINEFRVVCETLKQEGLIILYNEDESILILERKKDDK